MSKVFFAALSDKPSLSEEVAAAQKVVNTARLGDIIQNKDFVAIKLHVGEKHNTTHVKPAIIKTVVDACKSKSSNIFLTETSTLYKGERENAIRHLLHAEAHGFGIAAVGAPWIMADGLYGNNEVEIEINGELEKTVKIAREIAYTDVLIAVSHPTGHINAGLGACLKNLGMGLASRAGKLRQHSSVLPVVSANKCKFCQKCIRWCPAEAIGAVGQKARIDAEKCMGCGECLTVCRFDAIQYNWGIESEPLQKRMVEHACGVLKGKANKSFFINVLVNMTQDCDCFNTNQTKMIKDIGIIGSFDPVAVDKATLDLTQKANGKSLAEMAYTELNPMLQLNHAVKLGMGKLEYELVEIN